MAALEDLGLGLEHSLQDGPLSKQLLACLRVIVSTADELAGVTRRRQDPLAGPLNPGRCLAAAACALPAHYCALVRLLLIRALFASPCPCLPAENEDQALRTLEIAIAGMLEPLQRSPLLAQAADAGDGGGSGSGGSAAAEGGEAQAEQQLGELRLQQQPATEQPAGQQPQSAAAGDTCNENGFDGDWRMSRHFCRVYLQGQLDILSRSQQECRRLLAGLAAAQPA